MNQRLPFGFALGFGFAVFAAFLKSCALGASLLLGFLGFFPAFRRALMFAYRPFDGMAVSAGSDTQSDDSYSQQNPL